MFCDWGLHLPKRHRWPRAVGGHAAHVQAAGVLMRKELAGHRINSNEELCQKQMKENC